MNFSLLTPPKPPAPCKPESDGRYQTKDATSLLGRTLASKLSAMKKAADGTSNVTAHELASTLSEIRMILSRKGLLRGDAIRAEAFLTKVSETSGSGGNSSAGGSGGGKRRKKDGGGSGGSSSKAFNFVDGSPSTVGHGIADDEGLLLISLGRILGAGKAGKSNESSPFPDVVIQEASEALLAICRHVTTYLSSTSRCSSAEYELLLPTCPQLLSGLGNTATNLLSVIQSDARASTMYALASCHRAASSIVNLMGTRLSRSTSTMDKIASSALESLFLANDNSKHCVEAAAALLAIRPLAGNADGVPPAKLWTDAVLRATRSLTLLLNIFFPMHKSALKAREAVNADDKSWVDFVERSLTTQAGRTNEFVRRFEGYSTVLKSLLDMEGYDGCRAESYVAFASVPLGNFLDLVELMLAFPSAAEARYLSTKPRLRSEPIKNGALSPNSAMIVANEVKYCGLELFGLVLSATNTSSLVHGGRIIRIAYNSLQSCCSYALRRSIDPVGTPAIRADGKRGRRWLHDSLHLRSKSVKVFGSAILTTGPSVALASEGGSLVAKGLVFVSGCLLEQTNAADADPEADWGTLMDRIEVASACADALNIAIAVTGPYLESSTRSTIESVTATCLSDLPGYSIPGPALSYSSTICSLLRLGSSCVCAPWSDGAASRLTGPLRSAAESLKGSKDHEVSSAAYSTLCVCDAIMAPRSPPMMVVTRSVDAASGTAITPGEKSGRTFFSSDILRGIEAARKDAVASGAPLLSSGEKRKADVSIDSPPRASSEGKRNEATAKQHDSSSVNPSFSKEIEVDSRNESEKKKFENEAVSVAQMQPTLHDSHTIEVESKNEDDMHPCAEEGDINHAEKNNSDEDEIVPAQSNATNPCSEEEVTTRKSFGKSNESEDSDSDMDGFPEIVDVGPDEGDA